VEKGAKNYDDFAKLRFIMLEKAKQKRSVISNFARIEDDSRNNKAMPHFG
jgi:hypothetical protein